MGIHFNALCRVDEAVSVFFLLLQSFVDAELSTSDVQYLLSLGLDRSNSQKKVRVARPVVLTKPVGMNGGGIARRLTWTSSIFTRESIRRLSAMYEAQQYNVRHV
jgi:hypothetical protein